MLHKRIQKEHIVRLQTCDALYKWVFLTFIKRQKCVFGRQQWISLTSLLYYITL